MKKVFSVMIVLMMFVLTTFSRADQVVYQPGPFQGTDMWLSSVYNQTAVDEWRLQTGGWGDEYRFFIKFDLDGLPLNATSAVLWMLPYDRGDSSTLVGMYVDKNTGVWDESTTVYGQTPSQYLGSVSAPTPGYWYGINFTSIYNNWKSGVWDNHGFKFRPQGTNNQFSQFYSSGLPYVYDWARPQLIINYTPTVTPLSLKMPLPGNKSWMVTTEIGAGDCKDPNPDPNNPNVGHTGVNYFSIDFGGRDESGILRSDLSIYAAAGGKVVVAEYDTYNGNYIVIDYVYDGNLSTGYQTRYLHLKDNTLQVSYGDDVSQGQLLATMGNTGYSDGIHLHFGVRYANVGSLTTNELTFVSMEGINLKSYMTECDGVGGINGNWIAFYPSTNTQ